VHGERLFYDQFGYHRLWLWFRDRELSEGSFDRSVLARNYQRPLSADVAKLSFAEVYALSRQEGWASYEHFTTDGTLIESWASLKSFVRKDGTDVQKVQSAQDEDPGNATINFRGEKRRNDTHLRTTDAESVLYRKGPGKGVRLCFGGQVLMENCYDWCADFTIHDPIAEPEPVVALRQVQAHQQWHEGVRAKALGADQADRQREFVAGCREQAIAPQVACKERVKVPGLDGRTTAPAFVVAAYHLLRMARLSRARARRLVRRELADYGRRYQGARAAGNTITMAEDNGRTIRAYPGITGKALHQNRRCSGRLGLTRFDGHLQRGGAHGSFSLVGVQSPQGSCNRGRCGAAPGCSTFPRS